VAAREGGGDLDSNATLRTMYAKARDASVPLDTIERAVKRGTGELEGVRYEPAAYEGYAPAGVAVYVEVLTDNRKPHRADIRFHLHQARRLARRAGRGGVAVQPEGRRDIPEPVARERPTSC
jgi:transcriptional/translational regulatory protein YebC/TACO1